LKKSNFENSGLKQLEFLILILRRKVKIEAKNSQQTNV